MFLIELLLARKSNTSVPLRNIWASHKLKYAYLYNQTSVQEHFQASQPYPYPVLQNKEDFFSPSAVQFLPGTSPSLATASWQEHIPDLVSLAQAPKHQCPQQHRSEALLTDCSPLTAYEVVSQNPGAIFKDYWKNKIASFFLLLARRVRLTSLEAKGPRILMELVQPKRPSHHHAANTQFPGPLLFE